ncbi:MAG: GntR family transcriptional regulator [Rhodomicrobium sp.]|nr:GntR family transcriptional regulator [Rhodomicrobium sp.]
MSKNNKVYDLIVERLVNAKYSFGDRLLVKELAAETGASRQPIMSAINRLSADGFVRIIPQVGCQVINPTRDEIADFFLLFQRLEGVLVELAAKRRTEEQLRALKAAQRRIMALESEKDPSAETYAELNRDFHHTMHLMAHSPMLAEKQRSHFNMSDFFINHSAGFSSFMSDAAREHDKIIDAITKQQPERARLEAESHIAAVASNVLFGLSMPKYARKA